MTGYKINNWDKIRDNFKQECSLYHNQLLDTCSNPEKNLTRVLADCVIQNKNTAFGKKYHFQRINTLREYRSAVPIHEYADLAPWISRILAGENHILTSDDPYLMQKTSGTTGPSKAIPQTSHWRFGYRGPIIYALWGSYIKYFPQIMDHPHAVLDFLWEREKPVDFMGKFPHQGITNREISLGKTDFTPPWYDAPWVDFTDDTTGFMERIYLRIRHFIGQDLRALAVIQPNRLILIAQILSEQAQRLIEDVHNGELWGRSQFPSNPALAANLEELVLKQGSLLPKSVWPNLNLIACWKSKSLCLYLEKVLTLYPDTEILPLLTGSTEAIVTCPVDRHPDAGILTLNQGIYEFIPQEEDDPAPLNKNAETLAYDQLTPGKTYSVITTQANGFYRYALGDLYRVVGYLGRVPRLSFVRRMGIYNSFNGEKLIETQVTDAFQNALDKLDLPSELYACCPVWASPPHYTFIVETGPDWPVHRLSRLPEEIDRQLSKLNSEYQIRIKTGRLGPATVKRVALGTFQEQWNAKVAQGACAPQLKHHFCQKNSQLLDELSSAKMAPQMPVRISAE
jgi:GH3 auxin-responsive promoter